MNYSKKILYRYVVDQFDLDVVSGGVSIVRLDINIEHSYCYLV